jgi:hypothetical protein
MSKHIECKLDEALKETFPASDPPALSGITGGESPTAPPAKPSHERSIDERPTGTPTSDRHAAETAHHWEHHEEHQENQEHHNEPPKR